METYLLMAFIVGLVCIAGLILLGFEHRFERRQAEARAEFITRTMIPKIKEAMMESMEESMDMLPEKMRAAIKAAEEDL